MFRLIYMKLPKPLTKMFPFLKKDGAVFVIICVVAVGALYYYSCNKNTFPLELNTGANEAAQAVDGPSQGGYAPSKPLGQNSSHASASGTVTDTYGLPPSCAKQQVVDPSELLPKDNNSEFSKLNPMGSGDLKNVNLLKAGWHIGINTVGQSLRNANLQLRSDPPNPQLNTGPWNNSTIGPDNSRRPLEIGAGH